jgi:hypothetical protein
MNGRNLIRGFIGLVLTVSILQTAPQLLAQPGRPITGEGTEGFRALLMSKGLKPLDNLDDLANLMVSQPSKVLIVAFHGEDAFGRHLDDPIDRIQGDLHRFVLDGGALFVATDQPLNSRLVKDFGESITGVYVRAGSQPAYRGSMYCPFVDRSKDPKPNLFRNSGSAALQQQPQLGTKDEIRVATNRPSHFGFSSTGELSTLAVFRPGNWNCNDMSDNRLSLPFAKGREYDGGGRVLLLADHSIFINSMLLPTAGDNDNLLFASNCLDWLTESSRGNRTYVCFLEDGHLWRKKDYDLKLSSVPNSPEDLLKLLRDHPELADVMAAAVEESGLLQEIERADPFNEIINQNIGVDGITRLVLILGAAGLFAFGLVSLIRSRHSVQRNSPRLSMVLNLIRPSVGLLDQRINNGVGRGLYYEVARQNARQMFADLNITPAEGAPPPIVSIDAPWWRRNRIARDLLHVWAVAFDPEPVAITRRFEQWNGRLSELGQMIRRGSIHIG